MNQILVTKKLYVTPELKRKRRIYKFNFLLSIFFIIILISVYIYAEYDRNKSEEVSQEILAQMDEESQNIEERKDATIAKDSRVLVVVLDDSKQSHEEVEEVQEQVKEEEKLNYANVDKSYNKTTSDGYNYRSLASISIPKIGVNYPILEGETMGVEETDSLLKISPCKFWGGDVNEIGNYCIVGHNYRNNRFFSKVPTLEIGDTFTISEVTGREVTYKIYDKYTVEPKNVNCTSQLTAGKKEVTLITCTNDSQLRYILKAREIK